MALIITRGMTTMIRSRWLAFQAAALLCGAAIAPTVHAQGRCPFLAQFQMQMQQRSAPQPMMVPQVPQQQFMPPMMTPPRMPIAATQPVFPQNNFNMAQMPRVGMPGFTLATSVPRTTFNFQPQTTWQPGVQSQMQLAMIPTLQWKSLQWISARNLPRIGMGDVPHIGFGSVPWTHFSWNSHMATGVSLLPHIGFASIPWLNTKTESIPKIQLNWKPGMAMDNGLARIPSINLGLPRMFNPPGANPMPGVVAHQPEGGKKPTPINVAGPNNPGHAVALPPALDDMKVTGKVRMTCGSCHSCKAPPPTATANLKRPPALNPGLVLGQPARPQQANLPVVGPQPAPRLPQLLAIQPPSMPRSVRPVFWLPAQPGLLPLLTAPPTLLTTLTSPPAVLPAPGLSLLAPPAPNTTQLVSAALPMTAPVPSVPLVVATMNPPTLAAMPVPAETSKLQLPSLAEYMLPVDADPPAACPVAKPKTGPSLIVLLSQPPLLPSGAAVAAQEAAQGPILDEPPILPALVDTLLQPPPLPPLPGA